MICGEAIPGNRPWAWCSGKTPRRRPNWLKRLLIPGVGQNTSGRSKAVYKIFVSHPLIPDGYRSAFRFQSRDNGRSAAG